VDKLLKKKNKKSARTTMFKGKRTERTRDGSRNRRVIVI